MEPRRRHIAFSSADPNHVATPYRTMRGAVRQFSPDGTAFAYTSDMGDEAMDRGLYTMSEDGSSARMFVPVERFHQLTPNRNEIDINHMTIGNTKWTPDGQRILVAMWPYIPGRDEKRRCTSLLKNSSCMSCRESGECITWRKS